MKTSIKNRILAYLKTGETLTALEALFKFGCYRLSARIYELRAEGWNIVTLYVTETREDETLRYAEYKLIA